MTIEQLRYFLAVGTNLNFSATADDLCISQSSLSKHIKTMEEELEVQLFVRSTRSVKLTDAGQRLKFHAEKVLDDYEEMLACVRMYSGLKKRSFTISAIPVLSNYGITGMITAFSGSHPGTNIQIQEADAQVVIRSLENHDTDLGILRTRYLKGHQLQIYPLMDDQLVLVTHRKHRFVERGCVSLAEAANEQFFLLGEGTFMYQTCIDECVKAGFFPRMNYSEMRLGTIQSFIKQGAGVSLLMEKTANILDDEDIATVRIMENPVLTLAIVARNEPLPPVCQEFVDFAASYFVYSAQPAVQTV